MSAVFFARARRAGGATAALPHLPPALRDSARDAPAGNAARAGTVAHHDPCMVRYIFHIRFQIRIRIWLNNLLNEDKDKTKNVFENKITKVSFMAKM